MKIQIISREKKMMEELMQFESKVSENIDFYSGVQNSLDILSFIISGNASLILLDDDFTCPNSVHLLESVRKVNKEQKIIFLTSDDSIDIGKKISSLGVQFYAIKPISKCLKEGCRSGQ